jgi:hypothetical protein
MDAIKWPDFITVQHKNGVQELQINIRKSPSPPFSKGEILSFSLYERKVVRDFQWAES